MVLFSHPLSKQEKKKLLYKKNRAHEQLFQLMRLRRVEAARVKEMDEAQNKPKKSSTQGKKDWNDKVVSVRNRLTGKKRESKERWNRFAGTGDAGGRGL